MSVTFVQFMYNHVPGGFIYLNTKLIIQCQNTAFFRAFALVKSCWGDLFFLAT